MKPSYTRKKDPEAVRSALLESASKIATSEGFSALTLQSVASAAKVTKGGLFHHFANKQSLIEAMIHEQLFQFEAAIESRLVVDAIRYGRFTRAYVATILDWEIFVEGSVWGAMASYATADCSMRVIWSAWMHRQLENHQATDEGLKLEAVRFAADGAWLSFLVDNCVTEGRVAEFKAYLLKLTID